jgi:hypothetical protein
MLIPHTRNSFQMAMRSDLLSNKPLERPGMIAPLDVEAASAGRSALSRWADGGAATDDATRAASVSAM